MVSGGYSPSRWSKWLGAAGAAPQAVPATQARPIALEYLRVGGVFLLCLLVGGALLGALGLNGETFEWGLYALLGAAFPLGLLAMAWAARSTHPVALTALRYVNATLAACCLPLCAWLMWRYNNQTAASLITLLGLTLAQLVLTRKIMRAAGEETGLGGALISGGIIGMAWLCAAHFLWFASFENYLFSRNLGIATLIFALLLTITTVFAAPSLATTARTATWQTVAKWLGDLLTLAVFAVASGRSDSLFTKTAFHHWGVYVGAAAQVREGGWLLWDVPSQYGFLSILAIAWFPGGDVWQALYLLNGLFMFLTAAGLYGLFRALRPGPIGASFAALVAFAAVFWLPGDVWDLGGPQMYPSTGPYRFIWCYALLGMLVWAFRGGAKAARWSGAVGCAAWLLGTLWSAESAIYCAAIWLPAYALLVWSQAAGYTSARARRATISLAVPALLLAGVCGILQVYYLGRLGHGPDWWAYVEYLFSFGTGFGALPIAPTGTIWTLLFVSLLIASGAYFLLRDTIHSAVFRLLLATWCCLWVTGTHFVGRSDDHNATQTGTILFIAIGVLLYVLARSPQAAPWKMLLLQSSVPLITMLLVMTVGNVAAATTYISSAQVGYRSNVAEGLPLMDQPLRDLLRTAGVQANDPLIVSFYEDQEPQTGNLPRAWFVDDDGRHLVSITRPWLPMYPWTLLNPLSEERRSVYMARYAARSHLSGWLIQPKSKPYTERTIFAAQLLRTHQPAKVVENGDWQLIWFEYRAPSAARQADTQEAGGRIPGQP